MNNQDKNSSWVAQVRRLAGSVPVSIALPLIASIFLLVFTGSYVLRLRAHLQQQHSASFSSSVFSNTSRSLNQLHREHLRLMAVMNASPADINVEDIQLQQDLVSSRLNIYLRSYLPEEDSEVGAHIDVYQQWWTDANGRISDWLLTPSDIETRKQLVAEIVEIEREINDALLVTESGRRASVAEFGAFFDNSLASLTWLSFTFATLFSILALTIIYGWRWNVKSQTQLRRSEGRNRAILDAIPDAVLRLKADGTIIDYKPSADFSLRYSADKLIGMKIYSVIYRHVAIAVAADIAQVIQTGQPATFEYEYKSGKELTLETLEARYFVSARDEVQVIVRNITELKQLEESLRQTQKLESLGVLAGGIAHDFNNLLTGMLAQSSLALHILPDGAPAAKPIAKAVKSAERAATLVGQLLAYAGKSSGFSQDIDLNQVVVENASLLETAIVSNTELIMDLESELPMISADMGQIQQIVMNLIINAAEAGKAEGENKVLVKTEQLHVSAETNLNRFIGIDKLDPGHYIVMQVDDTGVGMDAETIGRIFDPFFSTKSAGRGLGLSSTLGIIKRLNGGLELLSNPGEGTCFRVYIPVIEESKIEPTLPQLQPA